MDTNGFLYCSSGGGELKWNKIACVYVPKMFGNKRIDTKKKKVG